MHVRNKKIIRQLSWKSLKANRTRNLVAILAIALTALLFTSLFTIAMSINEGMQQSNFRQAGGYAHGTFKRMTEEQYNTLKDDSLIAEHGVRRFLGSPMEAPFNKGIVEIGYGDETLQKFWYCTPTTGRAPKEGTDEAAMDTGVLELLGIEPKLGEKITLTFTVGSGTNLARETTQTFTLCGWWEKDDAVPASEVFIPNSRVNAILDEVGGNLTAVDSMTGTWNMDVMLESGSRNIGENLDKILADHGYQSTDVKADNYIGTGVNWGYTGAGMDGSADPMTVIFLAVMLLLILFTGYLIIYNVFQISVAGDIRFYGLLKTIGTTPRQIRRIIRQQALALSAVGIPLGLVLGWLVGKWLMPVVVSQLDTIVLTTSTSPWIFVGAALFALATVFISCLRPGRLAGRVSPVEAVRYTEASGRSTGSRKKQKISLFSMAWANLGRSRGKTIVTVASLALAVVLLTLTATLVSGFNMDKYISHFFSSDFQIADATYYQSQRTTQPLSEDAIAAVTEEGGITKGGRSYGDAPAMSFVSEDWLRRAQSYFYDGEALDANINSREKNDAGEYATTAMLLGLEDYGLDKLTVVEGSVDDLYDPTKKAIAVSCQTDDYGNPNLDSICHKVGDTVTIRYVQEWEYFDLETGEVYADPGEIPETSAYDTRPKVYHDVDYTVVALVAVPSGLGYNFSLSDGDELVLGAQSYLADSTTSDILCYSFDTDEAATANMESFLANYTSTIDPTLNYKSKQTYADEFNGFRSMFTMLGGTLGGIIAVVGVLNVFNAILTGITSRRRELAMLQSIGMTKRQLSGMLVIEGLLYTLGAVVLATVLVLVASPILARGVSAMFWWFDYRFTFWPLAIITPLFAAIGVLIPLASLRRMRRHSVVDRLREE